MCQLKTRSRTGRPGLHPTPSPADGRNLQPPESSDWGDCSVLPLPTSGEMDAGCLPASTRPSITENAGALISLLPASSSIPPVTWGYMAEFWPEEGGPKESLPLPDTALGASRADLPLPSLIPHLRPEDAREGSQGLRGWQSSGWKELGFQKHPGEGCPQTAH